MQILTQLIHNNVTPHITPFLASFYCQHIQSNVSQQMVLTEFADCDSLYTVMKSHMIAKTKLKTDPVDRTIWYMVILFQVIYTLSAIQKFFPHFRHNDLHLKNILLVTTPVTPVINKSSSSSSSSYYQYIIDDQIFMIPDIGVQVRIADFDMSCIAGIIPNNKVIDLINYEEPKYKMKFGISDLPNQYYDLFTFCLHLYRQIDSYNISVHPDVIECIKRIIRVPRPSAWVQSAGGRLLSHYEKCTPINVLREYKEWDAFRIDKNSDVNNTNINIIATYNANNTIETTTTNGLYTQPYVYRSWRCDDIFFDKRETMEQNNNKNIEENIRLCYSPLGSQFKCASDNSDSGQIRLQITECWNMLLQHTSDKQRSNINVSFYTADTCDENTIVAYCEQQFNEFVTQRYIPTMLIECVLYTLVYKVYLQTWYVTNVALTKLPTLQPMRQAFQNYGKRMQLSNSQLKEVLYNIYHQLPPMLKTIS